MEAAGFPHVPVGDKSGTARIDRSRKALTDKEMSKARPKADADLAAYGADTRPSERSE